MPTTTLPQIVMEADSPRTRRTDTLSSHRAADRSQKNLHATKHAVLTLILQEGYLSGEELNDLYSIRTPGPDWPKAKFDTPRKRAGELCSAGYLMNVAEPGDWATYCLTEKGLEAIA